MRTRLAGLAAVIPLLCACDDKINPEFEADVQAAQEKMAGDKFSELNNFPGGYARYIQADKQQQPYYLAAFGSGGASASGNAMQVLTALPTPAGGEALAQACKSAVEAALTFKAEPPADVAARLAAAKASVARLGDCRNRAREAEKTAPKDGKEVFNGWRRTASTTMMVIGATLIEKGDGKAGADIWREADKAMMADRPGYQFRVSDFRHGHGV